MENLCGVCFQPAELFQVPGYTIPSCIKCSEQLAIKGLTSGIYANPPRPDVLSHSLSQVTATTVPTQPTQATGTAAAVTATMNGTNVPQQQQSQQQSHLDQNQKKTENFCDCTGRHSSSCCLQNLLKLPFDLEQTLQNIDNELLFGDEGSCPICSKTFGRKSSLLNHIRNHSAEKKYICTFCQKGFTQAANLRNHERIHTNERPFVCIDCGKAFTQVTNLNNHRRLHTGERPFVCIEPDCGRSFAQVTNLNNHMKTHHKIQQYVCNQCPRRFTQVSQLNQHLTTHTGVRGFVCPQCPDKSFKQQSHLQQHLKTHGLDFPYACARCDEKFVQFVHLEHHMKMHEEFRFKCNMCASSFNQEVLLKKHIQRHIDGRYLTCPIEGCNEGFTIKHHLTRHMQQHHSINSNPKRISVKRSAVSGKHNCYFESCDESFGDPESLNEHLRNVHGLSIVKNVGKRSKMDLMLLEQMKNNANNTNNKNMENAGGPVQHFMQNFAINDQNIQPQQLTSSAQSAADSSKRILSVTEMINMTDEQMRKQAERKAQLELDMQVECPNSSIACSQQRINDVTSMRTGIIKSEPERGTINIMRLVCNICFNMFKTPVTLARHTQKFHT